MSVRDVSPYTMWVLLVQESRPALAAAKALWKIHAYQQDVKREKKNYIVSVQQYYDHTHLGFNLEKCKQNGYTIRKHI